MCLVTVNHSTVKEIVSAGKDIQRTEHLQSHLMSVLDEITEHVIIA